MDALDERYTTAKPIAKADRSAGALKDNLSYFSREIKEERYQIRAPEVQKDWGIRKTELQRRVGKLVLMTDHGLKACLDMCESLADQKGIKHQFTVIVKDEEGVVQISHDKANVIVVRDLIKAFLKGAGDLTREELADVITCHYNLSYHHFTKEQAFFLINESEELKKSIAVWAKCDYSVMKHPRMRKEAKRFMVLREKGSQSTIRNAMADIETLFRELNIEIEDIMLRKERFSDILSKGALDGDFVLRAVKVLNSALIQYRNRLSETNVRLVLKKAHEYRNRALAAGLYEPDLINEGTEGMLKAAEMYVSCSGVKFTTYADPWINLKITRHIKNTNEVRVPIHCTDLKNKILGHLSSLGIKDGDAIPDRESVEVALAQKISDSVWEMAINRFNNVVTSLSCDHSYGGEEGSLSFDTILGDHTEDDNDILSNSVHADQILKIAKERLSKNEYEVLSRHFMHEESYNNIHPHLDRHYSSKSISMIKTRAIAKVQEAMRELMPDEFMEEAAEWSV